MSASGWFAGGSADRGFVRGLVRSTARVLGNLVAPALGAVLLLRFVFPTRLAGSGGGVRGFLAWLADQYPLFTGVGLFVVLAETWRYWQRRWCGAAVEQTSRRATGRGVVSLAAVALSAFVVRSSIAASFIVSGPSMLPTLEMGDRVLVDRLAYGVKVPLTSTVLARKAPARGDLVVFRANGLTGAGGAQSIVKRVIGLPGDRITAHQGSVQINGWSIPACDAGPYVTFYGTTTVRGRLVVEYLGDRTYLTVRNMGDTPLEGYTVKPGEAFVLGDDRGNSTDSRVWTANQGAGVPVTALEGRVSRVLVGARPDGRLDFSRMLAPPLDLEVRMPGFDMRKTDERIAECLKRRPQVTTPPAP